MKNEKAKLSEQQQKILERMELVFQRLIESKRKTGGELVIMKDDKIVRVKP